MGCSLLTWLILSSCGAGGEFSLQALGFRDGNVSFMRFR